MYDEASKKKFKDFFIKPKARAGRPKKKKRGRPAKKKSKKTAQRKIRAGTTTIDLTSTPKKKQKLGGLDAQLHGAVASYRRARAVAMRTNWDNGKHAAL